MPSAGGCRESRTVGDGSGPGGLAGCNALTGEPDERSTSGPTETAVPTRTLTPGETADGGRPLRDDWRPSTRLVAADPDTDAEFGAAPALSGATALVGSPGFRADSAAYLFDL